MRLVGLSWGDPWSPNTYCRIPYSIFSFLKENRLLDTAFNSKFTRPSDLLLGGLDLKRTVASGHLVRNALWRYLPETQALLSRRFSQRSSGLDFDGLLQFGVAVQPGRGVHLAHIEITVETAASIPCFARSYGFDDQRLLDAAIAGEKEFISSCDMIWTNSEWTAQGFYKYGVEKEKLLVLAPCCESLPAPLYPRKYDVLRLLFIGRDWQRKGLPSLLQALEIIKKEYGNAVLTIVGVTGSSCNNIKYLGELNRSDPRQAALFLNALHSSNLLCLPSSWESFGVVCLEAASTGLPVLLSKGQGREHLFPSPLFLHLDSITPEAIAETILDAFRRPEELQEMSEKLPSFIEQNFSPHTRAEGIQAVFKTASD